MTDIPVDVDGLEADWDEDEYNADPEGVKKKIRELRASYHLDDGVYEEADDYDSRVGNDDNS